MFRFIEHLPEDVFVCFLSERPAYFFSQLSEWARVKNWSDTNCGLYENDRLAAAAQLLIRTFPFDLNRIGGLISWKADIILS